MLKTRGWDELGGGGGGGGWLGVASRAKTIYFWDKRCNFDLQEAFFLILGEGTK